MNKQQKLQKIVEAAGECWHNLKVVFDSNTQSGYSTCKLCKESPSPCNPSPTDMNELFRLAEKIGSLVKVESDRLGADRNILKYGASVERPVFWLNEWADTPAEALLDALYEAVKEQ